MRVAILLSLAGLVAFAGQPLTGQAHAAQSRPVLARALQPYPAMAPAIVQPHPVVAWAVQAFPVMAPAVQAYPVTVPALQPYPVMARAGAPSTSLPSDIDQDVDGRATPGHDGGTPADGSIARPVGRGGLAHPAQSLVVLAQSQPAPIVTAPLPPLQATPDQPAAPQPTAPATPDLPARPNVWLARPVAIIQALDKVNAQSTKLTIKVGQQASYESLTIAVRACVVRPPDQAADAAAFLVITDSHKDGPGFSGWMDHADPSLSMLEHPLYDVRVLGCGGG